MTKALTEPSATADVVELSDFLELRAIQALDRSASVHDLVRDITRAGTAETLRIEAGGDGLADPDEEGGLVDPRGDLVESLGQSAIAEIEARAVACAGAYPFSVDAHGVVACTAGADASPYVFMLLLTRFGGKAAGSGHPKGEKLFEDLSEVAAAEYFGWVDELTFTYPFGFPRRMTAAGFERALNELCDEIREGQGCRERPDLARQKDATLDIVVARPFPDRRPGQLIGFGQCATGSDWRTKLGDLRPEKFVRYWMVDPPAITPIAMFFVPHTIEEQLWLHTTMHAGVLFDRCRLAYHTTPLDEEELQDLIAGWNDVVLANKVRT